MLHTLLEMKIAICQEGYFYLDKILRKQDFGVRDVLLTVLIQIPMYYPANGISEPYFNLYGTTGITRLMEITNPETSGSFHRPATAFAEQVLNILSVAMVLLDEERRCPIPHFIWHFWDYAEEPFLAGCFRIF
ncbi:hypothetical protein T4E_355 [Trichinella pseudospiralis]|uniref:Uncharacterized protein n=1 Tax=Trichinella pseudospiralis TaxID=6337 RepID=A0A0V0YFQ1_TRIPS|nr:hypothetical protein T4E_355 [Trichinella pseudospiralis]